MPCVLAIPLCRLEGFAAAVQALQAAEDDARRRMPGQAHYLALLQAVAAGLAEGAPAGLQKVGAARRQPLVRGAG